MDRRESISDIALLSSLPALSGVIADKEGRIWQAGSWVGAFRIVAKAVERGVEAAAALAGGAFRTERRTWHMGDVKAQEAAAAAVASVDRSPRTTAPPGQ